MKKSLLIFLFILSINRINAQAFSLIMQMNDESEVVWTSETLRNIHFYGDVSLIIIEKETHHTHSYLLSEINKLYFQSENGTEDFQFENSCFVYPNPAKNNINIIGVENQNIEIYSIDGKKILGTFYQGDDIDISSLPQGLYIIKVGNQSLKFNKI